MLLPLGMLRTLGLSPSVKASLCFLFLLGSVEIIIDITRTILTLDTSTYDHGVHIYLDMLEPAIAILISAIVPYRATIVSLWDRVISSSTTRSRNRRRRRPKDEMVLLVNHSPAMFDAKNPEIRFTPSPVSSSFLKSPASPDWAMHLV